MCEREEGGERKVKRGRERVRAGGQESDRARAPRVGSGRWGGEVAGSGVVNVEGRGGMAIGLMCIIFCDELTARIPPWTTKTTKITAAATGKA